MSAHPNEVLERVAEGIALAATETRTKSHAIAEAAPREAVLLAADELMASARRLRVVARVEVNGRRNGASHVLRDAVTVGQLHIDPLTRQVTLAGREIQLSNKEFRLLLVLASEPTRVFTRDELLRDVWGYHPGSTRTLDSHASRLRRHLIGHPSDAHRYVINCWGVGYRLVEA